MKQLIRSFTFLVCLLAATSPSSIARALDTAESNISGLKAWPTYFDVILPTATHTCGGNSTTYKLYLTTANYDGMFKLLTSAWLAGKSITLNYTCTQSEARIGGVRAS